MAIDSHWNDTVLLMPFAGVNNSRGIIDEKHHTVEITGSAVLSTTQAPSGCASSLYLNGNNSYVSVISPANYDLRILYGEFTIEFSFYWLGDTVSGTAHSAILIDNRTGAGFELELSVTGSTAADPKKIQVYMNGSFVITGTTVMSTSWKWVTLARVWDGAAYKTRLFIDGVQEGSTYTDAVVGSNNVFRVGGRFADVSGDFRSPNGFIGPLRVTRNGRGLDATFTPPSLPYPVPKISGTVFDETAAPAQKTVVAYSALTGEYAGGAISSASTGEYSFKVGSFSEHNAVCVDDVFDPPDDEVIFNLFIPVARNRGEIHDTKNHPITIPAYNAEGQIDATINPWPGQSSMNGAGSATLITAASGYYYDYIVNLQDFSAEMMFYPVDGGHGASDAKLFQLGTHGAEGCLRVYCTGSDNPAKIHAQFYNSGAWVDLWAPVATTVANNTWHKLQLRRSAGIFQMIINGTVWGTSAAATSYSISGIYTPYLYVGVSFNGNIGPFRLSVGPNRAAQVTPTATFLKTRPQGSSSENAQIYDRIIPVG